MVQNDAGTCESDPHKIRTVCSSDVHEQDHARENENPGALAGATGADVRSYLEQLDNTLNRIDAASAFSRAVAELHPDDRISALEATFDFLRPGAPLPAFYSVMAEAYA
ncbi:MAG: hypothetical protein ACK5IP_04885 [Paracoccus sp. (in: a-proteobacteria)]